MATIINEDISTRVWTDVSTTHSLTTSQKYFIQNIGHSPMEIVELSSQPLFTQRGHRIKQNEGFYFVQDGSLNIYVIARGQETDYAITESE